MTTSHILAELNDELSGYPLMLTVTQTAGILNISRTTVYRLIDSGDLERIRVHLTGLDKPSVRIPADSVRKLFIGWVGAK
jgi:excisionase family DNA binding protein